MEINNFLLGGTCSSANLVVAGVLSDVTEIDGAPDPELDQAKAEIKDFRKQLKDIEAPAMAANSRQTTPKSA